MPRDVFGQVDFLEFLRLASIFRGEEPFEEIVNACVDAALVAADVITSALCDSDKDPCDSPCDMTLSAGLSSTILNLPAAGNHFRALHCDAGAVNFATVCSESEPANTLCPLRL